MADYYTNYLIHHGIKGQKWGVRRYQNFDGTYTKAGLDRYYKSLDNYNEEKRMLKVVKDIEKDFKKENRNRVKDEETKEIKRFLKNEIKGLKADVAEARQKMNKDYRHLKQDKLADKGKALYAQGKRITSNRNIVSVASTAAGLAIAGAEYAKINGMINSKSAKAIQAAGVGLAAVAGIAEIASAIPNRQLRAYYAHTSNY